MISKRQFEYELDLIIKNALREDIGSGDHSSLACLPDHAIGRAHLLVKDQGVIAGVDFAERLFTYIDADIQLSKHIADGTTVSYGDIIFEVSGRTISLLQTERVILNVMQRMSAIATKTQSFVKLLHGTKTKILDTRKTTPCIRALEKWAVRIGGGENHRYALYDMIMLKDNHIAYSGGISRAINDTKKYLQEKKQFLPIIIEAQNIEEVREILTHEGLHRILLDNFDYEDLRKAVSIIGGKYPTEASGKINETNIKTYADCGVDYVSCGALTHSVYNMDLSLKAI